MLSSCFRLRTFLVARARIMSSRSNRMTTARSSLNSSSIRGRLKSLWVTKLATGFTSISSVNICSSHIAFVCNILMEFLRFCWFFSAILKLISLCRTADELFYSRRVDSPNELTKKFRKIVSVFLWNP